MSRNMPLMAALCASLAMCGCSFSNKQQTVAQQATYESPEAAVDALANAVDDQDRPQLRQIFGPQQQELSSGNPQQDQADMQRLSAALQRGYRLEDSAQGGKTLLIGPDEWPFPVPLVQQSGRWSFDTAAGIEAVLDRRVGRNELNAIATSHYLVAAQKLYYQSDPDHDGTPAYAPRMVSTPGKRDGLYWPADGDQVVSPLGPLITAAVERGDIKEPGTGAGRQPYRGYFYKTLRSQGPAAPGGEMNYIDDGGRMTRGFALLAWPAEYGRSGVMSFVVAQDDVVYQADLGQDTQQTSKATAAFNPDANWSPVMDQPTTAPATKPGM